MNKDYTPLLVEAKNLEEIRRFKHDYKNKIFGLKVLLEAGEYARAKDYLNALEDEFLTISSQVHSTSYSDNIIVDAVLQTLAEKCKDNGIDFSFSVTASDNLNVFSDNDVCNLFCNLADNAFEAATKYTGIQKHISVYSSRREKWFVITVENSFDGMLETDSCGAVLTTKSDKANHGFGIKSIKKIVEKVPGSVYKTELVPEESLFKTFIFLPK